MPTPLPWHQIDTVLLDMDGTLIDLHFDSHLWQQLVPERYAARLGLPLADAKAQIEAHYQAVGGTLDWYCVDYWSQTLGLDIRALKQEILDKIQWRPHVIPLLAALRAAGKQLVLFTNAHPASLSVLYQSGVILRGGDAGRGKIHDGRNDRQQGGGIWRCEGLD